MDSLIQQFGPENTAGYRVFGYMYFPFGQVLFFSFRSNKISPLSLDKQASPLPLPNRNKRRIEGRRKRKEKKNSPISSTTDTDLFANRPPSTLPVCFFFSTHSPQQLPFSTYTHNTHTTNKQSLIYSCTLSVAPQRKAHAEKIITYPF